MSHADEIVLAYQRQIAQDFPLLDFPLDIKDDPTGDFAIATYRGFDEQGRARLTFDADRPPTISVVAHELFHGGHELAAGRVSRERLDGAAYDPRPDDPVLLGYWAAMAYGTPLDHAIRISAEKRYWTYFVGEHIAEALAYVATGSQAGAQTWFHLYGGDITQRIPQLREFFAGLRSQVTFEGEDMDDAEFERRYLAMNAKHVKPTIDAVKDAFNDHDHGLVGTEVGKTTGPNVHLGNEPS